MKKNSLTQDIINILLDGINIKLTRGLTEPYDSLISAGYADYNGKAMRANWKTSWWHEPVIIEPIPIDNRFEILDI